MAVPKFSIQELDDVMVGVEKSLPWPHLLVGKAHHDILPFKNLQAQTSGDRIVAQTTNPLLSSFGGETRCPKPVKVFHPWWWA
jgi:hypothetical protein